MRIWNSHTSDRLISGWQQCSGPVDHSRIPAMVLWFWWSLLAEKQGKDPRSINIQLWEPSLRGLMRKQLFLQTCFTATLFLQGGVGHNTSPRRNLNSQASLLQSYLDRHPTRAHREGDAALQGCLQGSPLSDSAGYISGVSRAWFVYECSQPVALLKELCPLLSDCYLS